jgi:ketosteroid isomerase-like protein
MRAGFYPLLRGGATRYTLTYRLRALTEQARLFDAGRVRQAPTSVSYQDMAKHKHIPAHAGSPDEIEAAFYEALRSGDIDKLMACWADEDEVVCVHPGGPRLVGVAQIRSSFEALFANGTIQARPERIARVQGLGACMHSLIERLDILTADGPAQALVMATNVYHQGVQGWRMVAHHASPGSALEPEAAAGPGTVLH